VPVVPPAAAAATVPIGAQSKLAAVQHAELPIANALAIPRLLASVSVPNVVNHLLYHGVGTRVDSQQ
jgi:hypothetical protein